MTPLVIPIFIAHHGCPHRCVFCDQFAITGQFFQPGIQISAIEIKKTIEEWLSRPRRKRDREVQVAFYGGSFTGLSQKKQEELLCTVSPYLDSGDVDHIRLSTRPDYISEETPGFLRSQGVGCVELGVQSMTPRVLKSSGRSYTPDCVTNSVKLLQSAGLSVGIQMMIGLPDETSASLVRSAEQIAALLPDFIRIYPTLVIKRTALYDLYLTGAYKPLSLKHAIAYSVRVKEIFDRRNIRVIRIGLQSSETVSENVITGPYHPAFGELVLSRAMFREARRLLALTAQRENIQLTVSPRDVSVMRGSGNRNMKRLTSLGLLHSTKLKLNPDQRRQTVSICRVS